MNLPADFNLEISGRSVPVKGLSATGFLVHSQEGLAGYTGLAQVALAKDGRSWLGDLQVRAEKTGDDVNLVLSGSWDERRRFVSVLNWFAGRVPSFADRFADLPSEGARAGARGRQLAKLIGLGLLSLGLILAISEILIERDVSVISRVAYVATPGAELESNTAGQVVYLKEGGQIDKGEFFAAVRTTTNYAKFLEANTSGDVSTQAVSPNDYVRKGAPVVRLTDEKASPYVVAFVRFSDAVAALSAAEARIEFPQSGRAIFVPVEGRNYVNGTRVMMDDDGKPLAEIQLRLPEDVDVPLGESIVVTFGRHVRGFALLPRQWLSLLSSLLS